VDGGAGRGREGGGGRDEETVLTEALPSSRRAKRLNFRVSANAAGLIPLCSPSREPGTKRGRNKGRKFRPPSTPPPQVTRVRNRGRYQGERVINSDRPGATLIILLLEFARALSLSLSLYLSIYLIIIGWRHRASFSSLPS